MINFCVKEKDKGAKGKVFPVRSSICSYKLN